MSKKKLDWLLGLGVLGIIAGYIFQPKKVEEYVPPVEEYVYVPPVVAPEEYVYVPPPIEEVYVAPAELVYVAPALEWEWEYAGRRYATYDEALTQYEADGMICPSPIQVLKTAPITTVACVAPYIPPPVEYVTYVAPVVAPTSSVTITASTVAALTGAYTYTTEPARNILLTLQEYIQTELMNVCAARGFPHAPPSITPTSISTVTDANGVATVTGISITTGYIDYPAGWGGAGEPAKHVLIYPIYAIFYAGTQVGDIEVREGLNTTGILLNLYGIEVPSPW